MAAADVHDADIYLYSGPIDDRGFGRLAGAVTQASAGTRDRAILILVTNGGLANSAYQIARFMQKMYPEFWVYCPRRCKSAGTLVALGAHRLIMDSFSELGPLDVQLLKEDEIGARKSGLLARATFDALSEQAFSLYERLMISIKVKSKSLVSFKLASQLSADMTSNLLAQVYGQISPDIVGNEKRDLDVAVHYGRRLGRESRNIKPHTVDHLVGCYPSHDFIIDDDEARQWFNNVDVPSEEMYTLLAELGPVGLNEASEPFVLPLTADAFYSDDDDEEDDDDRPSKKGPPSADPGGAPPMDDGGDANQRGDSVAQPTHPSRGRRGQSGDGEGVQPGVTQLKPVASNRK